MKKICINYDILMIIQVSLLVFLEQIAEENFLLM